MSFQHCAYTLKSLAIALIIWATTTWSHQAWGINQAYLELVNKRIIAKLPPTACSRTKQHDTVEMMGGRFAPRGRLLIEGQPHQGDPARSTVPIGPIDQGGASTQPPYRPIGATFETDNGFFHYLGVNILSGTVNCAEYAWLAVIGARLEPTLSRMFTAIDAGRLRFPKPVQELYQVISHDPAATGDAYAGILVTAPMITPDFPRSKKCDHSVAWVQPGASPTAWIIDPWSGVVLEGISLSRRQIRSHSTGLHWWRLLPRKMELKINTALLHENPQGGVYLQPGCPWGGLVESDLRSKEVGDLVAQDNWITNGEYLPGKSLSGIAVFMEQILGVSPALLDKYQQFPVRKNN